MMDYILEYNYTIKLGVFFLLVEFTLILSAKVYLSGIKMGENSLKMRFKH